MSTRRHDEHYTREIMDGDFDEYLNEAEVFASQRSQTSMSAMSRSNSYRNTDRMSVESERSITNRGSVINDMDDLLHDLDCCKKITPTIPKDKMFIESMMFSCQLSVSSSLFGADFFNHPKFCNKLRAEIKEIYSVETTITMRKDKLGLDNAVCIIDFRSKNEDKNQQALESVRALLAAIGTKLVDDQAGIWVRNPNCAQIIQRYSDENEHLHILCNYETIGLIIVYFDKNKSNELENLCITSATLDKIIKKFTLIDIFLPSTSDLTITNKSNLAQDILRLEDHIRSENILITLEQRCIRLFGFVDIVREVEQDIEKIKIKYASSTVKLSLEPQQIRFLLNIYHDELKALETNFNDAAIIEPLKNGEFTAPSYVHNKIEEEIMALASLSTPISFEIPEEAFGLIAHKEYTTLQNIGHQYKCQIEIEKEIRNKIVEIPKAAAQDHVSNKLTAAAIRILTSDLAEQKVDLVVVNSTSQYLRDGILEKAGGSVKREYDKITKTPSSGPFELDSGQLLCRKLLFLTWNINQTSQEAFYQSIRNFVSKAVQYAIKAHHTSIAFPAIGCGKFNFDKNIVANEMLVEAQRQLLSANVLLQINFVILPTQNDVFEIFQAKLESLQKGNVEINDIQMEYSFTTLTITIISNSLDKQEECKKALNNHVRTSISVREHYKQHVLKKWTQPAINAFYKFCFHQQVVPDMSIVIGCVKLFGSKESVTEVENEYYREQAKQSEQARLMAIARDIIWAFEKDDKNWEKYVPELNALIEDAYTSQLETFEYTDDKSIEYIIDLKQNIETCINSQQQRLITRHVDHGLPPHWQLQTENVARFSLDENSDEYKDARGVFNKTMSNKYDTILRIERIQNKQWYTQYNSYKSFSSKKDTERKLFHGCRQESIDLIINSFFNRSFAGVNGTVYGQGAYFSANASYSHNYAKPSTQNSERYMFVVSVIVGKSTLGNTNMKIPPAGFDSTTDGDHIYVTYRDDQAYAEYLIVYK
ncbi:unnamed protein product [Rotaria magnacalcarata]|uniref:Poly [ADP-ribose] polymerase n=2 Tax=Rotaria magnacalcarata TaxID=392030 RepID=A0A816VTI3_9BILA|nr:unnamed protein product [Rotaria magnacalcarata]